MYCNLSDSKMAFSSCKKENDWFQACQSGNADTVKKLLKGNAKRRDIRSVEQGGFIGFTGLMYAAYEGHLNIFEMLYEQEFDMFTE